MVATSYQYKHTQVGYVTLISLGAALIAMAALLVSNFHWVGLTGFTVIALCLVAFASLTVEVSGEHLRLWFGPGFPRQSIPVRLIQSVRVVTNSPLHGWGIHWAAPGWIYNVSGLRGVELRLSDGRRVRIGSDEPEALAQAIEQAMTAG
jgi:hypothetical protein